MSRVPSRFLRHSSRSPYPPYFSASFTRSSVISLIGLSGVSNVISNFDSSCWFSCSLTRVYVLCFLSSFMPLLFIVFLIVEFYKQSTVLCLRFSLLLPVSLFLLQVHPLLALYRKFVTSDLSFLFLCFPTKLISSRPFLIYLLPLTTSSSFLIHSLLFLSSRFSPFFHSSCFIQRLVPF